jgi:hypothetical protein
LGRKESWLLSLLHHFFITERVGKVAYRLDLPDKLSGIHPVFHISMLRKFVKDDRKVVIPNIDITGITVRADTSYEVEPVRLLARSERKLRSKVTPTVKVLWDASDETNTTWEIEEDVRHDFLHLFDEEVISLLKS